MTEVTNHVASPGRAHGLDDILQILRTKLPEVQERYGVRSLGVFGSYARGEQHTESDLDLLVEFEEAPSLLELAHLENELSDLLGVRVDLVMKTTLRPTIGKRILREVVPL